MKNSEFIEQTIEKLTKQGVFGYGSSELRPHTNSCLYRTPEGHSCGIGVWLDDKQAAHCDNERHSAADVFEEYPELFSGITPALLEDIQLTHDNHAELSLTIEECVIKLGELKAKYPD